jgi:spore maturation protein CgeB
MPKITLINTYYPNSIAKIYHLNPELHKQPYQTQLERVNELAGGRILNLSKHFERLGYEVQKIVANASSIQRTWARENDMKIAESLIDSIKSDFWERNIRLGIDMYSGVHVVGSMPRVLQHIAIEQVKKFKPDVIFDSDMMIFSKEAKKQLRQLCRVYFGESGYALPTRIDLSAYHFLLSCDPAYVENFKAAGLEAYLWHHGFEHSQLDDLNIAAIPKTRGIVFTGSVGRYHKVRREILIGASKQLPVEIFGKFDNAPSDIVVKPAVFGGEMLKILASAHVTFNSHYDIAERYAGNMRLFEATGVGSCLLTDWKINMPDLFDLDHEVVTYKTIDESIEKAKWLIEHPVECDTIGKAGQNRTLHDHTLQARMDTLDQIIRKRLAN